MPAPGNPDLPADLAHHAVGGAGCGGQRMARWLALHSEMNQRRHISPLARYIARIDFALMSTDRASAGHLPFANRHQFDETNVPWA